MSGETCAIAQVLFPYGARSADGPSIIRLIVPRSSHCLVALAAALAAAACLPAGAHAAALFAAPGGAGGPGCSSAAAPCSLSAALVAARGSPGADVVNLAPGTYNEVISATSEADTDVTIQGSGDRNTIISGAAADAPVVQLGAVGTGTMAMQDLMIDGSFSSLTSAALRSRLAKLTLTRVRVLQTDAQAKLAPAIDSDASGSELVMDGVEVLANTQTSDPAIGAVNVGGPLTMRDSIVTHTAPGDSAGVYARGNTLIQRSLITHDEMNAGYALRFANTTAAFTIVVDSSVLRGGNTAARFDVGTAATQVHLRGVTAAPTVLSNGYAVNLNASAGGSLARMAIDSSLLLNRSVRVNNGAQATCSYTNLPPTGSSGSPNCPTADGNALGNSRFTFIQLRLDPSLAPLFDSPAVDSGNPAGVAPGESPTDRLSRVRAASSADVCDAGPGTRDRGAFERYRPLPSVAIIGPDRPVAGVTTTYTASTDSRDPSFAWSFGEGLDGGSNSTTSRAFAVGAAQVALTVTDRVYNCAASTSKGLTVTAAATTAGAGGGPAAGSDRTRPKITRVKLSRSRISRRRNATLSFTLSEAARVTITVSRLSSKKKVISRRKLVTNRKRGSNRVKLTVKRFKWRRALYSVRVSARDAAGNNAKSVARSLRAR